MLLHELMMLYDEGSSAWKADFQEGLIVGLLAVVVLAIATGVLALTLVSPPNELGELGQRIATWDTADRSQRSARIP
jgi:hypothetical protein